MREEIRERRHDEAEFWLGLMCVPVPDDAHAPDALQKGQGLLVKRIYPDSPADKISPRELECLRWVANGKTDAEIAEILSISEATVKFHVNGARRKLGARNRAQATARLVLSGLY